LPGRMEQVGPIRRQLPAYLVVPRRRRRRSRARARARAQSARLTTRSVEITRRKKIRVGRGRNATRAQRASRKFRGRVEPTGARIISIIRRGAHKARRPRKTRRLSIIFIFGKRERATPADASSLPPPPPLAAPLLLPPVPPPALTNCSCQSPTSRRRGIIRWEIDSTMRFIPHCWPLLAMRGWK